MAREGIVEKRVGMTAVRVCVVDMWLLSLAMPPAAHERVSGDQQRRNMPEHKTGRYAAAA